MGESLLGNTGRTAGMSANAQEIAVTLVMPLAEKRGGSELMLWHVLSEGRGLGVRWNVVYLQDGPMVAQTRDLGIAAQVVEAGRMRDIHRIFFAARHIARIARDENSRLIASWISTGHLYGGTAAKIARLPALWYDLGIPTLGNPLYRIAGKVPAREVWTCSGAGKPVLSQLVGSTPIHVVYPGVELDRFNPDALPSPREARAALGLPLTGPLIGIYGRLQRWKGMHVLVEAMPRLLERYGDAHAVIVGGVQADEAEYEEELRTLIVQKNLGDKVVLAGLQTNVQMWMQAADIIVHASDQEPFGIVITEALSLGKPVVATNTAGPTEIITPDVHGLLTPYGDANALCAAIEQYLRDPDLRERVSAAGRERARDFSVARYAQTVAARCREAAGVAPYVHHTAGDPGN